MMISNKKSEFLKAYSDYYPLVLSILRYRLKNSEDAEDICQDLFVSFYNKFDEIRDRRKWLMGAIRFEVLNHYRNKGTAVFEASDIDAYREDEKLAVENIFRDARIVINEAIENMENFRDEKEKILFDLIALYGFTHEQAARQLGLTKKQVEYKYARTARTIMLYLRKKGISTMGDIL